MDLKARTVRFFGHGGGVAIYLVAAMLLVSAASTWLFIHTMVAVRFQRDVLRMVAKGDTTLLETVQASVAEAEAALRAAESWEPPAGRPYIVVSLEENQLWLKKGGEVLFNTAVATGSGKTLIKEGGQSAWKFDTPRGRLVVQGKEEDPFWAPPDWHYVEQARKRGLSMARFERGQSIRTSDGGTITVQGDDVVRVDSSGRLTVLEATDGREIVADGRLIVPPLGTNQRKYKGVLGSHRLKLGQGYALHGTNNPSSIGRSVSHGCIRLRNEDIAKLYAMVPVGTPVYIY
jgi:hypothetical protein